MSVRVEAIDIASRLERELIATGRPGDAAALNELISAVARPGRDLLTTGQASLRLGVSVQTVKNWIQRGTLRGVTTGTRWLVSESSVATVEGIRRAFAEASEEGYPTPEQISMLTKRTRRTSVVDPDVA